MQFHYFSYSSTKNYYSLKKIYIYIIIINIIIIIIIIKIHITNSVIPVSNYPLSTHTFKHAVIHPYFIITAFEIVFIELLIIASDFHPSVFTFSLSTSVSPPSLLNHSLYVLFKSKQDHSTPDLLRPAPIYSVCLFSKTPRCPHGKSVFSPLTWQWCIYLGNKDRRYVLQ